VRSVQGHAVPSVQGRTMRSVPGRAVRFVQGRAVTSVLWRVPVDWCAFEYPCVPVCVRVVVSLDVCPPFWLLLFRC
jgi:hypothetical protein